MDLTARYCPERAESLSPFKRRPILRGILWGSVLVPSLIWTLGMLGDEATSGFKNEKEMYSQIRAVGLLIKNEILVLNTFQISIAFYPLIPGVRKNILKLNSFETTDFGFMDFEMGKPASICFQ